MIGRIRQFLQAMGASLSYEGFRYVAEHLSEQAQALFYGMHPADQVHALRVALTAEELAREAVAKQSHHAPATRQLVPLGAPALGHPWPSESRYEPVNRGLLIRAALLHDVGRRKGDMDVWGKVFAVLMADFFPRESSSMAKRGAGGILDRPAHALFVYYNHPQIGAEMLRNIGMGAEADLALRHHDPPQPDEKIELTILRRADEMN